MSKLETVSLQGKAYALVPTRLKAFREANPRASVDTEPTITGEQILFKAKLISDKADPNSAEATGHSYGSLGQPKAFEKLETIAVGRALALLGYLNSGEVATTEEMSEFNEYKAEGFKLAISNAKTVKELMEVFNGMDALSKQEFTPLLSEKKKELNDADGTA